MQFFSVSQRKIEKPAIYNGLGICIKKRLYLKRIIILIERNYFMFEKKQSTFKSPDLGKLQEVVIDTRTKIYIAVGANPEEAKSRYLSRLAEKNKLLFAPRKPVAS
jgi:hypothetical protein